MKKILLWGNGSQSKILASMITSLSLGKISYIFDPSAINSQINNQCHIIHDAEKLQICLKDVSHFIIGIGSEHGFARYMTARYLEEKAGIQPLSVIHPNAYVDSTTEIGSGCQIMPGVTINKFTKIGKQCILNTSCTIDHESTIGNGVHIMGSAAIAGRIQISDWATIGTNATILPDLKIAVNSYVGAGSVVTKDTQEHSVVAGIPAKYLRKNNLYFQSEILVQIWGQLS